MTPETQTYYVTRYALTKGIQEVQGERPEADRMIKVKPANGRQFAVFFWLAKDAFETFAEAQTAAEEMRLQKIKSLKLYLRTLEKKLFDKSKPL